MKINYSTPSISHLMFANDLMIFEEASRSNLEVIEHILGIYSLWSRQVINFSKLNFFFTNNLLVCAKNELAGILGVKLMEKDEHSLGASLFATSKPISSYKYLIEKMQIKLKVGKSSLLSQLEGKCWPNLHSQQFLPFKWVSTFFLKPFVKRWRLQCEISIGA